VAESLSQVIVQLSLKTFKVDVTGVSTGLEESSMSGISTTNKSLVLPVLLPSQAALLET